MQVLETTTLLDWADDAAEEDVGPLSADQELCAQVVQVLRQAADSVPQIDDKTVLNAVARSQKNVEQSSYFILDPIDGTVGFIRGGSCQYVIGLAFVEDGKVVRGR